MARKLREWIEELRRAGGPQGFVRAHPAPFLLVLETNASEPADSLSFQTIRLGPASQLALDTLDLAAHEVVKGARSNAFAMMITVGRAPNNDLVLDVANVSKFHGFFSQRDGRWYVQDASSSNGTFLEQQQLQPSVATALGEDCRLRFATVKCRFLTAPRFAALLEKEGARVG